MDCRLSMIGHTVSFSCMIVTMGLILLNVREDRFLMYYAGVSLLVCGICFRICWCDISPWYIPSLMIFFTVIWNDVTLIILSGILFGGWDWFLCLCIYMCVTSMFACGYEYFRKPKINKLPRITYLEVW